ncbi:hypothetical protein RFI_15352, partial [Reticulomyxa filosa]
MYTFYLINLSKCFCQACSKQTKILKRLHELCSKALEKNFQYPEWMYTVFRTAMILCFFVTFGMCILLLRFGNVNTFLVMGGIFLFMDIGFSSVLTYLFKRKLHQ